MLRMSQKGSLCQHVPGQRAQKLVSVPVTSVLIIEISKEINLKAPKKSKLQQVAKTLEESELWQILYIHYLVQFSKFAIEVFINSNNKVNAMQQSFVKKLGLCIYKTNIGIQKIYDSKLKIFRIVMLCFR